MQGSKLVSVIVPVFNVEPYLVEALDSTLCQTYANLEPIVIDDGSTDGSSETCDEYASRDGRAIVVHQKNAGLSSARNAGLDCATGNVIAFLDPDDALRPNMIQTLMDAMEGHEAEIAICQFSNHETQGHMTPPDAPASEPSPNIMSQDDAFRAIVDHRINTAVWDKVYVREIWGRLRFPDGLVYEGTYCVFDIFSKAHRIVMLDEPLVMHRNRHGSICNTPSLRNIEDGNTAGLRYLEFVERHTPAVFAPEQLRRLAQARVRSNTAFYLHHLCEKPEGTEGVETARRMLIKTGRVLRHCGPTARVAYHLILAHPNLCKPAYRLYRRGKHIVKR